MLVGLGDTSKNVWQSGAWFSSTDRGGYASGCARCINRVSAHAPVIHSEMTLLLVFLANSRGQRDYHLYFYAVILLSLPSGQLALQDKLTTFNLLVPCEEVSYSNRSPSPLRQVYPKFILISVTPHSQMRSNSK